MLINRTDVLRGLPEWKGPERKSLPNMEEVPALRLELTLPWASVFMSWLWLKLQRHFYLYVEDASSLIFTSENLSQEGHFDALKRVRWKKVSMNSLETCLTTLMAWKLFKRINELLWLIHVNKRVRSRSAVHATMTNLLCSTFVTSMHKVKSTSHQRSLIKLLLCTFASEYIFSASHTQPVFATAL